MILKYVNCINSYWPTFICDVWMNAKYPDRVQVFLLAKRGCKIGNTKIDKGGDSPVFEVDSWNFQYMLNLSEASENHKSSICSRLIWSAENFSCLYQIRNTKIDKGGDSSAGNWYPLYKSIGIKTTKFKELP